MLLSRSNLMQRVLQGATMVLRALQSGHYGGAAFSASIASLANVTSATPSPREERPGTCQSHTQFLQTKVNAHELSRHAPCRCAGFNFFGPTGRRAVFN
jgi:hypothetical protein